MLSTRSVGSVAPRNALGPGPRAPLSSRQRGLPGDGRDAGFRLRQHARAGQRSCIHGPAPRAGVSDPPSSGHLRSGCVAECGVPAAGRVSAGRAGAPVGRL